MSTIIRKQAGTKPARSPSAGSKTTPMKSKSKPSSQPSVVASLTAAKPFGNVSVRSPNSSKSSKTLNDSRKKSHSPKSAKKVEQSAFAIESILEPVKPKRACSGYLFFAKQFMIDAHSKAESTTIADAQEFVKAAGQKWNTLTEKQKQPYLKQAEKDQKRFEREQAQFEKNGCFLNADGVKSTELAMLKRNFKPNVTTPKKLKSPYQIFIKKSFAEKYQAKLTAAAEPSGTKLGQQVIKELAAEWSTLSDKKKAAFKKIAESDQHRYDREMQQLLTQGFFIREDGTKTQNNRKVVDSKAKSEVGSKRQKDVATDDQNLQTASKRLKK